MISGDVYLRWIHRRRDSVSQDGCYLRVHAKADSVFRPKPVGKVLAAREGILRRVIVAQDEPRANLFIKTCPVVLIASKVRLKIVKDDRVSPSIAVLCDRNPGHVY